MTVAQSIQLLGALDKELFAITVGNPGQGAVNAADAIRRVGLAAYTRLKKWLPSGTSPLSPTRLQERLGRAPPQLR